MKRVFSMVITLLILIVGSVSFTSCGDNDDCLRIGSEKIAYTVIDTFEGVDRVVNGWENYGTATVRNGKILIECRGNFYDCYDLCTDSIAHSDWGGMDCIVFEVTNSSDGDVLFCFQPLDGARVNLYNSALLATEYPVKLFDTNKQELTDAKWVAEGAVHGRDGFCIPWNFTGYIFMSLGNLAAQATPTVSAMPENGAVTNYGFHIAPDDAFRIELTISRVLACAGIPGTDAQ